MNTMLERLEDLDIRARRHARQQFLANLPDSLFTFSLDEGTDASPVAAGPLLDQDEDFWVLDFQVESGGRAGPGWVSPRRFRGTLDLALFTKAQRDKVKFTGMLGAVADWFQDQTIDGIRFRTFIPTSITPVCGFTTYNGVINFEFEINVAR